MKLFKSSKKKAGDKKSRSALFGSRKGSKKDLAQQQKQTSTDVESSSYSSHADTATTMTPRWVNGSDASNGQNQSNALSYHQEALGGDDRSLTNPISSVTEDLVGATNNPFDEGEGEIVNDDHPCDSSDGSDIGEMESSADVLRNILTYVTEKEHKGWADGVDDSRNEESIRKDDIDDLLRKTVDRMDIEPLDVEVQRLGAESIYHLSKIYHQTTPDMKPKATDSWYASENRVSHRCDPDADDDELELITDALDAILQAMEDFPDDEVVIENACLAIEGTLEKRKINRKSSAKRILEEILMAIEGFADNPITVSSCLGILRNLSSSSNTNGEDENEDLRQKLAKYALPSILQGMKEHRDDLELYTKGCKAMTNFTNGDPNAQRILACKEALGLRIISEGLKYYKGDSLDELAAMQHLRLRFAAIQVLKNLSTHASLEVKGKIALGGGAARIIDRLLEALVCTGMDLVDNNYEVGDFGVNEDQVDEEDEVGISLAIMRDALQIIANLANIEAVVTRDGPRSPHMPTFHRSAGIDNSSAEDIQRQLTKAVKPVLNTIRQHPNRPSLQYHGLTCVRQLTISHADSIANHGGISTFLNVISSTGVAAINDSMIHERALSCLTGLLSPSSNANGLDLVASMETEDGLDAIFRTIRRYQSNTELIETSYESLFYLSCRVRVVLASIAGRHISITCGVGAQAARKLQSQLCLEENIFVMLGTLNQYFEASVSISQRGLGLLVNVHAFLTQDQDQDQQNQQPDILASDGGIRLVLAVMRRHGLAVAIQEYGVGLLAGILRSARSFNAIRREFVDEEGISSVMSAMMIHPDHAAVQTHGCDVLIQLMAISKHPMEPGYSEVAEFSAYYKKIILEETNAVAVVQESIDRFQSNKGVLHYGSTLLQELSTKRAVTPLSALPSKAASISTKLQSSFLSLRP